jgi:hypothetical protein
MLPPRTYGLAEHFRILMPSLLRWTTLTDIEHGLPAQLPLRRRIT